MDWRWHRDGVGKWVTYNERMQKNGIMKKGLFAIYPIEAKKIAECQENAKITDDDFKFIFFNAVAENELPIHLFTVDECLNIYFWERDEKFDLVAELYELAKSRLPMRNY
jgi:hypothetical protein